MFHDLDRRARSRWLGIAVLGLALLIAPPLFGHAGEHGEVGEHGEHGDDHRQVFAYKIKLGGSFLGIQPLELTPELRRHYGAPEDAGVLVGRVVEESPAAAAGLAVGDVLTAVDGQSVRRPFDVRRLLGDRESGETVSLELWRDGARIERSAVLTEREDLDLPQTRILKSLPRIHVDALDDLGFELDFDPGDFDIEGFDPEAFEQLGERLEELFGSEQWEQTMQSFHQQRGDVDARIEKLEQRLRELETQLRELGEEPRR